jgi:hypothetical protein
MFKDMLINVGGIVGLVSWCISTFLNIILSVSGYPMKLAFHVDILRPGYVARRIKLTYCLTQ